MLSRLGFNALAAATLGATALLGAYLPVLLSNRDRQKGGTGRSLGYVLGNMLSAGVMVSAGFCHLLGEALKEMPSMVFPLAPFLCGVGFILTLVCDAAAVRAAAAAGVGAPACHGSLPGKLDSDGESDPEAAAETQVSLGGHRPLQHRPLHGKAGGAGGGWPNGLASRSSSPAPALVPAADAPPREVAQEAHPAPAAAAAASAFELEAGAAPTRLPGVWVAGEGAPLLPPPAAGEAAAASGKHTVSYVTAVLLGVALCFHSVLEGAAMGAQATVSASMHIFIAVVSHKGLAAYALGSSVVDSGAPPRRFWGVVVPFTLASPIGIFVGYVVSDLAAGMGAASISAMAAGTFLYVAFMEVIPKELDTPGHTVTKLAALILGFALMSILAIWA